MLYREQIDKSRVPAHVAIIMDGNGRWAKQRGQIRSFGLILLLWNRLLCFISGKGYAIIVRYSMSVKKR